MGRVAIELRNRATARYEVSLESLVRIDVRLSGPLVVGGKVEARPETSGFEEVARGFDCMPRGFEKAPRRLIVE